MAVDKVASFFQTLRQMKTPPGLLTLQAIHWRPDVGGRDIGTRKKVIESGPASPAVAVGAYDGFLEIGERVVFVGTSPKAGYIHLFDFGTSGTTLKLGPSAEYPSNRAEAGVAFKIPSPEVCPLPGGDAFNVLAPTTASTGLPERLLVLLTRDDIDLDIQFLDPELRPRELYTPRSRGSFGKKAGASTHSKLFGLAADEYEYGLISLEVR